MAARAGSASASESEAFATDVEVTSAVDTGGNEGGLDLSDSLDSAEEETAYATLKSNREGSVNLDSCSMQLNTLIRYVKFASENRQILISEDTLCNYLLYCGSKRIKLFAPNGDPLHIKGKNNFYQYTVQQRDQIRAAALLVQEMTEENFKGFCNDRQWFHFSPVFEELKGLRPLLELEATKTSITRHLRGIQKTKLREGAEESGETTAWTEPQLQAVCDILLRQNTPESLQARAMLILQFQLVARINSIDKLHACDIVVECIAGSVVCLRVKCRWAKNRFKLGHVPWRRIYMRADLFAICGVHGLGSYMHTQRHRTWGKHTRFFAIPLSTIVKTVKAAMAEAFGNNHGLRFYGARSGGCTLIDEILGTGWSTPRAGWQQHARVHKDKVSVQDTYHKFTVVKDQQTGMAVAGLAPHPP
jgi:hypothetical protein